MAGLLAIGDMDLASLLELRARLDALISDHTDAILGEAEHPKDNGNTAPKNSLGDGAPAGRSRGRRWIELKMIGKCGPYRYERWFEGGKKRSRYLGKAAARGEKE